MGPAAGGALLLALSLVACTGDDTASAPRVGRVERASVSTGVTATGSLTAISQQNLGFASGGQLTAVNVKVGDRVEAGQVLATIDDYALRQQLAQQEGQLKAQQAVLDRLRASPVAAGAKDSLAQAQEILEATERQAHEVLQADEIAIDNAERQLAVDKKALEQAEDKLEDDREACDGGDRRDYSTDSTDSGDSAGSGDADDEDSSPPAPSPSFGSGTNPACSAIASDEAAVTAAKQRVAASKGTLDSAKQQRDVDKASGQLSIENARQAVVTARNNANSAGSDRPFDIAQQEGMVANAAAAVRQAQRDVENATLRAPVAGTVSAVNGAVGEYLAPSSGTTALAPGSGAAIPGTDVAAAAVPGAAPASPTRPGGTQFIVLEDIQEFQVVAPFNEADAATITPNQKVEVAVDALPDLPLTGTVLSVAPTGTAISGVVSYYVTMIVNGGDARLKDGQTVRATVVTDEVPDVLTVPSAAVRQENGRSTVTVLDDSGVEVPVPFEAGMVGPERTQVVSGLREGQRVVLPAGR
jgi:HlyD family secretion protein